MHHISKAESICNTIEELVLKTSRPINFIVISIGEFSSLQEKHMRNAFEVLRESRELIKKIKIQYKFHEGKFECLECGYLGSDFDKVEYSKLHGVSPIIYCNKCKSSNVLLNEGTDVYLETVGYKG